MVGRHSRIAQAAREAFTFGSSPRFVAVSLKLERDSGFDMERPFCDYRVISIERVRR